MTPPMPGVAPSVAFRVPELSASAKMRFPSTKGLKTPNPIVRFEWLSPVGPCPGPPLRSPVGSFPGPSVMTPVVMPFVPGFGSSMPLSSPIVFVFGSGSVGSDEVNASMAPPARKFVLTSSTR